LVVRSVSGTHTTVGTVYTEVEEAIEIAEKIDI